LLDGQLSWDAVFLGRWRIVSEHEVHVLAVLIEAAHALLEGAH
jgi:hypothetical protein